MDNSSHKVLEIPDGVKEIDSSIRTRDFQRINHVEIPNSVTKICEGTFRGCFSLTDIVIPKNVTEIGHGAFMGCCNVTSIIVSKFNHSFTSVNNCCLSNNSTVLEFGCKTSVIPYGVTEIKAYAFAGCGQLESIVIPTSVTRIGDRAFYNCFGLKSVVIPESVREIGELAFEGCTDLVHVCIRGQISKIQYMTFKGCTNLSDVYLPKSLVEIGVNAFSRCYNLEAVNIPDSVTKIGEWAFSFCDKLKRVVIPVSVREIGAHSFAGCERLERLEFVEDQQLCVTDSNNIMTIGTQAFSGCSSLVSINLPNNVASIGPAAFKCSALTSISVSKYNPYYVSVDNCCLSNNSTVLEFGCKTSIIPDGVKIIRTWAFDDCTELKEIKIPNSVVTIDGFQSSGLTKITIPNSVTKIAPGAFMFCKELVEVVIPDSVIEIGEYAFDDCSKLSIVNIPSSVIRIGNNAFKSCNSLAYIEIPESVIEIGKEAFYGCTGLTGIRVPCQREALLAFAYAFKMQDTYSRPNFGQGTSDCGDSSNIVIRLVIRSMQISEKVVDLVTFGISLFGERRVTLEVPIGTGYTYRHYPAFEGKLKEVIADLDV